MDDDDIQINPDLDEDGLPPEAAPEEDDDYPLPEDDEEDAPYAAPEDEDDEAPITESDEDDEDDPRNSRSVEGSTRSYIGWNMESNSPIAGQFNSFDSGVIDPYRSAARFTNSAIETYYRVEGTAADKQDAVSAFSQSISSRYGTTVRLSGTGIYNRTIRNTGSVIGSNLQGSEITLHKPPRGLVTRPVDRDWNSFQESNKSFHMREAVYQLQETSYVGGLVSRANTGVKTEIATQGFSPKTVFDGAGQPDVSASKAANKRTAKILSGNEVSLKALEQAGIETTRVTFDDEGKKIGAQFHGKLSYYYEEDDKGIRQITAGSIGTQNRTQTLKSRDSLEEVVFLHQDMVAHKGQKEQQKMQAVLKEVAAATDAMFSLGDRARTAEESRRVTETSFKSAVGGDNNFVFLNKDLHLKRLNVLEMAALDKSKSQVIFSTQYVEQVLFSSRDQSASPYDDDSNDYKAYKKDFFEALELLSEQGRLTLMMSATSKEDTGGLFALFDRLNNERQVFDLFGDDQAENTAQRIRNIIEQSVSIVPTTLKHSKGFVILDESLQKAKTIESSSANFSFSSYNRNIEAGAFFDEETIEELDLFNEDNARLYRSFVNNKRAKSTLYTEEKGNSEQVQRAKTMLREMGGVESRKMEGRAPFRFSTRYNRQGEEVGLDIVMKNMFSFSVTIGSVTEPRYNPKTGKQDIKEVPILYLNKGNRVIMGMDYLNKSSRYISVQSSAYDAHSEGEMQTLAPGEMYSADALQVLSGMIYTMNKASAYEENTRLIYKSVEKLLEQGDTAALKAIQKSRVEGDAQEILQVMKDIVEAKNVQEVTRRSKMLSNIITYSAVAQSFFKQEMRESKAAIFKQITEVFPQAHSLSYSHGQLLWKRPLYGLTTAVEDIHYNDDSDSIYMRSFLMSDMPVEHSEILKDRDGLTLIRGVNVSARPSTLKQDEMLGGLIKVKGGTSTPHSMQAMMSMPGMALIAYDDFKRRLKDAGISPRTEFAQAILENVFALEKRRAEEEEEGSWEVRKSGSVMIYTPYDKTEQNPQRFRFAAATRNFLPANRDLTAYVRGLGASENTTFARNLQTARQNATDLSASDVIGGHAAIAVPDAQFAELQKMWEEGNKDPQALMERLRERTLDTDEPLKGYITAPMRVMASLGISELNDYSRVNTTYANRERGYLKTYRSQTALTTSELNMTAAEFSAEISSRLKVGTMFIARDVILDKKSTNRDAYKLVTGRLNEVLGELGHKEFGEAEAEHVREAVKTMRQRYEAGEEKYSFIEAVAINADTIRLKKGVYDPVGTNADQGWLKQIGVLNEGDIAFTLKDMSLYTRVGSKFKQVPLRVKAPAVSSREMNAVSIVNRVPTISMQDGRSNMVTLNIEMVNISELRMGQRSAQAKGPFTTTQEEYFTALKDIYQREVGETAVPTTLTGEDIFAVISAGQMKGFVFEAGLGFLRQGENSYTWSALQGDKEAAGYKVAEALALLMLPEKGRKGGTVHEALSAAYDRGDSFENRRQSKILLDRLSEGRAKAKGLARKPNEAGTARDYSPTIAIYEGLMSLVSKKQRKLAKGDVEQALVETVLDALQDGPSGAAARKDLGEKALKLFEKTKEQYGLEIQADEITYNETRARSASVLAFYLNVARDMLSDVDTKYRMQAGGLSELGYKTDSFIKRFLQEKADGSLHRALDEMFETREKQINNQSAMRVTLLSRRKEILNQLKQATERTTIDEVVAIATSDVEIFNFAAEIEKLALENGGASSRDILLSERYLDERQLLEEGMKRQTFALGLEMPNVNRLRELRQQQSLSPSETQEREMLERHLDTTLHQLRAIGQFDIKVNLPFDMSFNKITVPTGMEDTTALEGHYANALTQRQLDLYTYSSSERQRATTLQQTLVILGSMLQEGLGSSLTQNDVSRLYSMRSVSAVMLGYTDFTEKAEDSTLPPNIREENQRYNRIKRALRSQNEAHQFNIAFSQSYGFFTSKAHANLFPTRVSQRTKDVAPAEELFHRFIDEDSSNYASALAHMQWRREVSSDKTNLSQKERALAITRDYLYRIKNNETIIGGQVDQLLSGITERSLEQLQHLGAVEENLFKDKNQITQQDDQQLETWTRELSPNSRTRAIGLLQRHNIPVDPQATWQEVTQAIKDNRDTLRNFSPQERLELASLGFSGLNLVLTDDEALLQESELNKLSMNERRIAFIQMQVRERVKNALAQQSNASVQSAINVATQQINSAQTVEERAKMFIYDAPETQERLLESIIRNEVNTRLERAVAIDPGKEYIEGRQQLRKYARDFLATGQGTSQQVERAEALIENINKTYRVSVPILDMNQIPDASGEYVSNFSAERQQEGWVLGLDVLERMSLVFPGHTHEALRAQYNLVDTLSRAQQEGVFEQLAKAAVDNSEVRMSQTQYEVYRDLVKYSTASKKQTLDLTRNKETFRKTMADRMTMTGASYIGMNTFLIKATEVGLGTRADSLVKANSGSGIKTLMTQIAVSLDYFARNEQGRQISLYENRINELTTQVATLQDTLSANPGDSAALADLERAQGQLKRKYSQMQRVQDNMLPNYRLLERSVEGKRSINFAQMAASMLNEMARTTGQQNAQDITWQDLFEMTRSENVWYVRQQQQAQQNQQAASNATPPSNTAPPAVQYERARVGAITDQLFNLVGGEDAGKESTTRLENLLFKNMVLVARQGAPSGVFHTYGQGHQMVTMETIAERANLLGSLVAPEIDSSSTGMFISSLGNQFTQLGDYDGDSFQAAFTKMSTSAREVSEASVAMRRAEIELRNLQEQDYTSPVAVRATTGTAITAQETYQQSVQDFTDKLRSFNELRLQAQQRGGEQLRGYITDLVGLPLQFLEGSAERVGAIKDSELSSLIKQSRDTLANLYGNQEFIDRQLPKALAAVETLTLNPKTNSLDATFVSNLSQETEATYRDTLSILGADFTKYSEPQELRAFTQSSLEEKRKSLIEFSTLMSQRAAALSATGKISSKIAGSLFNSDAYSNIQAIVGSTGTGLLGKTYNTVVPLLGMAVSDMSALRAMRESSQGPDLLSEAFGLALEVQKQKVAGTGQDFQEELIDSLLERHRERRTMPYELEMEDSRKRLNTSFGLLLDVQQFLRDAALKPKKGGSVALSAADFSYTIRDEDTGARKEVKGLNNILEQVDDTERSQVMQQFIGLEAGSVLAQDFGFEFDDQGRVDVSERRDRNEVRAFAALEMVNEYLSGKYTASEMMRQSSMAGLLRRRKEELINADPDQTPPSDEYVVESTLADTLAKFQSEFRYNAVLEASDYGQMFDTFEKRLTEGYREEGIEERSKAYRQKVTEAYTRQFSGQTIDPTRQQEIDADIDARVESWTQEEQNRAKVIEAAKQRASDQRARGEEVSDGQSVFKAIIEYETQKDARAFAGTDEEPGLFSALRSMNAVVSGLQADNYASPGTAQQFAIAQQAILYNIGRGKLEGTTLNESIFRLAEEVRRNGSSAEAVGALLSVGGATSIPGLMEFVQDQARTVAGSDTVEQDRLVRESLTTLGQILTEQVEVSGKQTSVAEIIAEKNVVSGSSAKIQGEINTLNMQEADLRQQIGEDGDNINIEQSLDMMTNMREALQEQLNKFKRDPEAAKQAMFDDDDFLQQALNDVQGQINQDIAEGVRNRTTRQNSIAFDQAKQELNTKQRQQSMMGLLAVPLVLSLTQGDVPITDRLLDFTRNLIESGLTLSTYEGSTVRQMLIGEGQAQQLAQSVQQQQQQRTQTAGRASQVPQAQTAQRTGQPQTQEQSYVELEAEEAQRNTARANYLFRVARSRDFMFAAEGRVSGLAQAVGFEALNMAGSVASSEFAKSNRMLRDDSLVGRGAAEMTGALVGMALAGVVSKRPITGTDFSYDFAFDATMNALGSIRDNVLAASQQAIAELVNGADVDITDGYTGETLDALFSEGDFELPDDNTSVSAVERMLMTEGMLEGEEDMYIDNEEG